MSEKKPEPACNSESAFSALLAEQIATRAHTGQFRRDRKTLYIEHPKEVVKRVNTEDEIFVAWLHDVIEDTGETEESLRIAGVPGDVIVAVKAMTHLKDESYWDYLKRAKQNSLSKTVKIADILANLSDTPTERQIKKYAKGLLYLLG